MRLSVGVARPVLAAERQRGRRLVDHYWPIVHNELHQRTRGDAALLDADRSAERSTSAAEHTDCVLAQSVNAQHARQWSCQLATWGGALRAYGKGRWQARPGRQATPCHREYVGRQQQPCCRWGPLRPRLFVLTTRHPRLHAALAAPARPALFRGEPILAWAGGSGCDGLGRLRELV